MKRTISAVTFALALILLAGASESPAQIRLATVPGVPGAFNATANVVFKVGEKAGFVANSGNGVLSKFRPSTGEILGSVQLTPGIGPLAISYDERLVVVLGVTSQRIYVIDSVTMAVKQDSGYQPSGFTPRTNPIITRDSAKVLIADPSRNQVAIFDTRDGLLDRFINVGINPTILDQLPDGRKITVLCSGKKAGDPESLWFIDTYTLASIDAQPLLSFNTEPFNNTQFTPTSSFQLAFIPSYNDNRIAVVDMRSWNIGSRSSVGQGPARALASPNGRFMAVINVTSQDVALFRLPEAIEGDTVRIKVPGMSFTPDSQVTWSPDGHTLYIPLAASGEILAYDVENLQIKGRITTGAGPAALYHTPDGTVLTSVDTSGNEVSLIALNPKGLLMPHLTQNPQEYSGIALANFSTQTANVAFVARSNSGVIIPAATNPRIVSILPGKTMSVVTAQLFGFDPSATIDGYIDAYTLENSVSVLYLTGTINQTQLDGYIPDSTSGKIIGFSRLTEGVSKFGRQTSTEIILENPTDTDANLLIRLYVKTLEGPATMLAYLNRVLPARQRIRAPLSTLVPSTPLPLERGYLSVDSDVAIKGMEIVKIGDSVAMLPAWVRGTSVTDFLAVQFASGGAGLLDTPIFSNLSFCNSSPSETIHVTIQVTDAAGKAVPADSQPTVITLRPYEAVSGGADELLGFPNPLLDPDLYQGTLQISVDKPGVLLDLLYGDARNGKYLTSADLHSVRGTKFALPHYAEGLFGDPPRGMYTGLALYNPNLAFASVVIEAYNPDGVFLGKGNLIMDRYSRVSKTIGQLVSAITQQNGGTVIITSDIPIYIFEVFGSTTSDFLVSVVPVLLAP